MKKALVIRATGSPIVEVVEQEWDLRQLNAAVGGYIEAVDLPHNAHGFINEEGKLIGLELNQVATMLARIPGDIIMGNMVVFGTNGPDSVDVPEVYHRLTRAFTELQVRQDVAFLHGEEMPTQ